MKLPKFLYLFKYPNKNRIQINLSKLFQNNLMKFSWLKCYVSKILLKYPNSVI